MLTGFEVDGERPSSAEGFVGSDCVEDVPVAFGLFGELDAVVDLESVEVLVLQ